MTDAELHALADKVWRETGGRTHLKTWDENVKRVFKALRKVRDASARESK